MGKFSIRCKDYDEEEGLTIGYGEYRNTFEIICDGKTDNNSFTMEYIGDTDFTVSRNRCLIDVYIKENKSTLGKLYTITCTHADDLTETVNIIIVQTPNTFSISTDKSKIILKSEIDSGSEEGDGMFYEEVPVNITVVGGSGKYRIVDISKYHDENEGHTISKPYQGGVIEDDTDKTTIKPYQGGVGHQTDATDVDVTDTEGESVSESKEYSSSETEKSIQRYYFDDGFILKKETNRLIIKSYGRPFIDKNDYYIIKLQHYDTRDIETEIEIGYEISDNTYSLELTENNKEKTEFQKSEAYMTWQDRELLYQTDDGVAQSKPIEIQYSIEFEESVEDYAIYGKEVETILPFTVKEGGKISDLMCKAASSTYWCRVKLEQKYNDEGEIKRKLIFKIVDTPTIERAALITVAIIDKPEIYRRFILTNKPSEE